MAKETATTTAGSPTGTQISTEKTPAWSQEAYIKSVNSGGSDNFGASVAAFGDTLAVGAGHEDSNQSVITNGNSGSTDDSFDASGAVYIYRRSGTRWAQESYIKAANVARYSQFGRSVSLVGDTLAVGSPYEDSNQNYITNGAGASDDISLNDAGAVYVYRRSGILWSQEAYIKAVNLNSGDFFGASVTVAGNLLAVGATGESSNQQTITLGSAAPSDNSFSLSGAVYVYRRDGTQWTQEAFIKSSNSGSYDFFGCSLSLSGDTLAVGAYGEASSQSTITNGSAASSDNSNAESGAVYVFRRRGPQWSQEAYIKATNSEKADEFGKSIALSGDTLVVGAAKEDSNQNTISQDGSASLDNSKSQSGAVYIFRRSGTQWAREAYVKAANIGMDDSFGHSVSISGNTLIVGTPFEDSDQKTISNGTTASANNLSGNSGAAYVYRRDDTGWKQDAYIKAINGDTADLFGYDVSVSGDTFVVGAPNESSNQSTITQGSSASSDNSAPYSGAAYIYRDTARIFEPDVNVNSATASSVSFTWTNNFGNSNQIKVGIATAGNEAPAKNCEGGTVLGSGSNLYTYPGLDAGRKYGFRFCAWDGSNASEGSLVWAETEAQGFESGLDGWAVINSQNISLDRNQTYIQDSTNRMLGPIGEKESISKTFALDNKAVTISFDLLKLDSWDGENFQIYATKDSGAESLILSSYPGAWSTAGNISGTSGPYSWSITEPASNTFCFSNSGFTPCRFLGSRFSVVVHVPSSPGQLKLRFTSTLNQAVTDEAWGIDNFRVIE
jgi:hypothetical protein